MRDSEYFPAESSSTARFRRSFAASMLNQVQRSFIYKSAFSKVKGEKGEEASDG